jgi:hypothetical protein
LTAGGLAVGCHDAGMARAMRRMVWLAVVVLVVIGVVKGSWMLERALEPERYRGIDMIAAIHTPGSWQVPSGRSAANDQYFPANSGRPPFTAPYNRWTRRYWAHDWSLARSFEVLDAAERAAGWEPDACRGASEDRPTKTQGCWKRPNFALTADFDSTDLSCNPRTHNCGTTIDVELAERTAG